MPARLMDEALRAWREGERVLEVLPPMTADHESVRLAIIRLRETYQRVAGLRFASQDMLATNRAIVEEALEVIRAVQGRANGRDEATV